MEGNGRRARDDGNEVFRRGMTRWVAAVRDDEESARGEDTRGRDIVRVASGEVKVSQSGRLRKRETHPLYQQQRGGLRGEGGEENR